jgi:hypothetical protein
MHIGKTNITNIRHVPFSLSWTGVLNVPVPDGNKVLEEWIVFTMPERSCPAFICYYVLCHKTIVKEQQKLG